MIPQVQISTWNVSTGLPERDILVKRAKKANSAHRCIPADTVYLYMDIQTINHVQKLLETLSRIDTLLDVDICFINGRKMFPNSSIMTASKYSVVLFLTSI